MTPHEERQAVLALMQQTIDWLALEIESFGDDARVVAFLSERRATVQAARTELVRVDATLAANEQLSCKSR